MVKNLPANVGGVREAFPGSGISPGKRALAIHSRALAWRIPVVRGACRLQFTGSQRVGQD